ncbi:Ceg14 family Dot/Icm T4SS effector [Legionella waltersii]|uniref:Substrate of the Dot/Icm secretion system n=1 Tax=Legionella waltersii TaxID=66969 RepID=A0A0W1ADK9_9GAMM|nr:Ceg14 family Dot/Icm T4SS effector [Legionella waltersii]KTD79410.1 substrate of the Dot/Icm secretion system [Legionella waltersii]SNU97821.1 Dot/Icm secretion system substrate [Legionella waltersii]
MKAKDRDTQTTPQKNPTPDTNSFFATLLDDFEKLKRHANGNADENNSKRTPSKRKSPMVSEPTNKFAALEEQEAINVKTKAKSVTERFELNTEQQTVWELIIDGIKLTDTIQSCDLPSDDPLSSTMVKMVQVRADEILSDTKKSWLFKILEIAIHAKQMSFGNCQEKAFFAFAYMFNQLTKQNDLIHTLRLATFNNHFILIVNEEFVMDPWLSSAFPFDPQNSMLTINFVFEGFGNLINYFSVDMAGNCIAFRVRQGHDKSIDFQSRKEFGECISWLNRQSKHFAVDELIESSDNPMVLKMQKVAPGQTMMRLFSASERFWRPALPDERSESPIEDTNRTNLRPPTTN